MKFTIKTLCIISIFTILSCQNSTKKQCQVIGSLNGVKVYENGGMNEKHGRNTTEDGYNLGLKYQCVEFVKRYYYEHLCHKMTNTYGNAKDYYDAKTKHGTLNTQRGLIQYQNGRNEAPKPDDLIIMAGHAFNKYGHVAIVSKVYKTEIEITQQNAGPAKVTLSLTHTDSTYTVSGRVLGWLRKEE